MAAAFRIFISQGNASLIPRSMAPSPAWPGGSPHLPSFPSSGSLFKWKDVGDYLRLRIANPTRRPSLPHGRVIPLATASCEGSDHSDIDVDKVKNEIEKQAEETQEAWIKTIESVKEHALKMQSMSQEAYELYCKQAMVILMDLSEQSKIEADKARQDMAVLYEGITIKGKQYLSTAVENSPEPVKDIVETFASQGAELKEISEVRDFFLGIPYGALLSIGGFLSFMLTGSIPSIRFGMILGGALLSLGVLSLRAWKEGKSSALFLKGQAGIAATLFIREFVLLCQRPSIWTSVMALTSGSIVAFYIYRIGVESSSKGGLKV